MAEDPQLWGYPEAPPTWASASEQPAAARAGAACPSPTTPACRTGRYGGRPPSRAGAPSAGGSVATCTAPLSTAAPHPGGRRQRHRIGPQRRSLGGEGNPPRSRSRLVRGPRPGRGRVPWLRLPGRTTQTQQPRVSSARFRSPQLGQGFGRLAAPVLKDHIHSYSGASSIFGGGPPASELSPVTFAADARRPWIQRLAPLWPRPLSTGQCWLYLAGAR